MSDELDSVRVWLAPDGPIARALGADFEPRPQQTRMAEEVARVMGSRDRLLVEAGTGVGKTFAYLVPAIRRIVEKGERVVVATCTIALQEQLLDKDVPLLRAVCNDREEDFHPVLVKGRGNYVSIRRLKLASQRQDRLFADAPSRRSLHVIEDWAYQTEDGTLSTLPPLERPGVWDRAQSDSGNCMGRRCPTYQQCFYQNARREMERANLLICNHAIFFSDLAMRQRGVGFLPDYDHVIIDEAHNVEDVASDHFGLSLGEGRVRRLLTNLFHKRTGKGFLSHVDLEDGSTETVDATVHAVLRAEQASDQLFDALLALTKGGRVETVRINNPGAVENNVTSAFRDLALRLKRLRENAAKDEDRFELNSYAERATEIASEAEALIDQTLDGCVYWVDAARAGADGGSEMFGAPGNPGSVRVTISCSPVDVAPLLRDSLFVENRSVIMTSATLATGAARDADEDGRDPFAWTRARLGCDDARSLLLGSPFDHANQVELIIDRTMPDPRDEGYVAALAQRVLQHVRETDGGAFVLFTSFATLRAVDALVRAPLEAEGMPVLAQGKDGSRAAMLDRFRADERSVLLGTSSFWQGVDVRGRALRNVVITRLPFEPPDRPLTQARLERIEREGGNPFAHDSLPRAVIRFKQGFGRLIRGAEDRGRVVVLDNRVATKSYGRVFLDAIPEGVPVRS